MVAIPEPLLNEGDHTDDHARTRHLICAEVLPLEKKLHLIENGDCYRPEPH